MAIEFGFRLFAGDKLKDVLAPRWADPMGLFDDCLDREAARKRTHQEWIEWFLDAGAMHPQQEAIQESLQGILDVLYDGGVVHGRFYQQNSWAWTAWSCIGYPLVRLADWPTEFAQIQDGCAVMASLIRIHAGDASNGIATKDEKAFLDMKNEETGRLASSFVSMTTGPGSDRQRAPFPEDFSELFAEEFEKYVAQKRDYAAKKATIKGYALDGIEGAVTGKPGTRFTQDAVAKALASLK